MAYILCAYFEREARTEVLAEVERLITEGSLEGMPSSDVCGEVRDDERFDRFHVIGAGIPASVDLVRGIRGVTAVLWRELR